MAVTNCKECGGQVATSAKACPHCGEKAKKKVGILGWLFVLFIVLPIAWGIGTGMGTAPSGGSGQQLAASSQSASPNAPAQLVSQWSRNEYKDAMTDDGKIVLSIRSLNSAEFEFPYRVPGGSYLTLAFRKQGKELDAYMVVDKGQMLCSYRDCSFSFRVGDGTVQTWTGLRSSSHDSEIMFIRDAKQLESIVKNGGKIRIGIEFYRAGTIAFDFETDGYPGF